jgi:hypothetical protein
MAERHYHTITYVFVELAIAIALVAMMATLMRECAL